MKSELAIMMNETSISINKQRQAQELITRIKKNLCSPGSLHKIIEVLYSTTKLSATGLPNLKDTPALNKLREKK